MTIQLLKLGPKPHKQDGTPDRRYRVTHANKPKHPSLRSLLTLELHYINNHSKKYRTLEKTML